MSPRTKFILIFLLFSVPFVGSTLVYVFWKPAATANYGELISPIVSLPEIRLGVVEAGAASSDDLKKSLRGKWLLMTIDGGGCGAACEKKIYAMRQARLMLGREQDRVLRVVLIDDETLPDAGLRQKYTGTVWVSKEAAIWKKLLQGESGPSQSGRSQIYGVDPLGNVFIRYTADPDIKRMNQDFQRVLKASQIG